MAAYLLETIPARVVDDNGDPVPGALLHTYVAGTSTPLATYVDSTGTTQLANPIQADGDGMWPQIWVSTSAYKLVANKADDATLLWERDNVTAAEVGALAAVTDLETRLADVLDAANGGGMIGHSATLDYATTTSGRAINARGISITDYPYNADPTGVVSASAAITSAIADMPDGGELIAIGTFLLTTTVVIDQPITLRGAGTSEVSGTASGTVFKKAATMTTAAFQVTANGVKLQNFVVQGIAGNTANGIDVQANRCTIEDVCTYAAGGDGVRIGTDAGVNANLWAIRNLRSKSNGGHGLHISDKVSPTGADANGGTLIEADLQSNGDAGLRVGNAQLNTYIGVIAQNNTGRGISLGEGADNNIFIGGDSEGNTADEIGIEAGASANKFIGTCVNGSLTDSGSGTQFFGLPGTVYEAGIKLANVGSSDLKTLDWYEEGSWTPAVTFATVGDLAVAYTTQIGRFQRVGNRVTASFTVVTSSFTYTTSAGGFRITGLPYTAQGTANIYGTGEIEYGGITAAGNQDISARVDPSTTYVGLFGSGSGVAPINIATGNVPTGGSIVLTGTVSYQV